MDRVEFGEKDCWLSRLSPDSGDAGIHLRSKILLDEEERNEILTAREREGQR